MISVRRRILTVSLWFALSATLASLGRALETKEWKYRQTVAAERAGILKLPVPPATLDAARPGLEDLRLLDPSGQEVPYVVEYALPTTSATSRAPESFRVVLSDSTTQLVLETGTNAPLVGILVQTPNPAFLKAARVELSNDGQQWTEALSGAPLFRQFGAEQLRLDLKRQMASRVRITIDDTRTSPVVFTGASLLLAATLQPAPSLPLATAQITHREEYAGETVLTVDLGAQHVPLASLEFSVRDALFTRKITVATQEMRGDAVTERTLGSGTIYRLVLDGVVPTVRLDVPLGMSAPRRELLVHVTNGDSPPLAVDAIAITYRPVWLVFSAAVPGIYTALSGNPDAVAPRYDVSGFASALKAAAPSALALTPLEENTNYQRRAVLGDTPLAGGAIDPTPWRFHRLVQCDATGVQQLELDLDVLAGSANNLADLRLVRDGVQVPYVLERASQSRALAVTVTAANDPKRPQVSRWQLTLPRAHAPITRLTLSSSTTLFQRDVRLYEVVNDDARGSYDRNLAGGEWHKTPGRDQTLVLPLGIPAIGANLFLETNNGDNPPLVLTKVDAAYPVVRLLFKANSGPLTLYYGNANAGSPRYDLALVADRLIVAEKNSAVLGPEEKASVSAKSSFITERAGILFWTVLAIVVIVLLVVVARLLPKPPAAS